MKNHLVSFQKLQLILKAICFIFFNIYIWNIAANNNLFQINSFKSILMLICEICWSISSICIMKEFNPIALISVNIIPIFLAIIGWFPITLIGAFVLIGIVNICLMIPNMNLKNYYGLFCFSIVNSVIPTSAINFLNHQYLDQNVVLNVGILCTLYFLFFNLTFHPELANLINIFFIIMFAGLVLANFPLIKDILLIALVLISYGAQIFSRQEKPLYCLISFIVISLIAFG